MLAASSGRLTVMPPLAAYRRDLERLGARELSRNDAAWLSAAVALAHAAREGDREVAAQGARLAALLDAATKGATMPPLDAPDRASPPLLRRARALAEAMEESSAWHLVLSVLDLAERAFHPDALEAGRIRAQRARVHWKSGAVDDAESLYRDLVRDGRRSGELELLARGYVGLALVNQLRGNYPAVGRWAAKAAAFADRERYAGLSALAHQLQMVSAGQRGSYARALTHGWTAFQSARGDPVREAEMLLNLAQLLVRMGEHHAALTGFVATLEREPPARIVLPAWGGVATSASHLRDARITRLAANRVQHIAMGPGLEYARASALAEAAQALDRLHLDADPWRRAALAIAGEYRFHEINYGLSTPQSTGREAAPRRVAERAPRHGDASTAVISAVDALADLPSSRVLV